MHVDTQIKQAEIAAGVLQVDSRIDLVGVWQDIEAVAFLVGNQGIERDVFAGCLRPGDGTAGKRGTCFKREIAGRPDRGEVRLQMDCIGFLVIAAALACKSQAEHSNHNRTNGPFAHQFTQSYRSPYNHLSTNIVK